MTTENRLATRSENAPVALAAKGMSKAEREQFWIERGNRLLWGEIPDKDGAYLTPRRDLEWRCKDGHYFITARMA